MGDTLVTFRTDTAHYHLRCLATGRTLRDNSHDLATRFPLVCPSAAVPALLRTEYRDTRLDVGSEDDGVFRFASWLPVNTTLPGSGGPITYHAEALGRSLGLSNLYVTFSGWWPERGARIPTGTFKENEAYVVYGRMGEAAYERTLVVASAGNTARAFLRVAGENDLPLVVVVPENNIPDLWTVGERGRSTLVVAAGDDSDYSDAIALAALLYEQSGYLAEGGARNVARRDGMGTTFLSAAHTIGRIPDHYFQAVGSGTGAIAAWEANLRLLEDGRYGRRRVKLHLAQNAPFQVLVDSWRARSRELLLPDEEVTRRQVAEIGAKVLANRQPPWAPIGGLFDALADTDGAMYAVTNDEAAEAGERFEALEGIDLSPAARVACGALTQAVRGGAIGCDEVVNLNVTGGGFKRAKKDLDTRPLEADVVAHRAMFNTEALAEAVDEARRMRVNQRG